MNRRYNDLFLVLSPLFFLPHLFVPFVQREEKIEMHNYEKEGRSERVSIDMSYRVS